MNNVRASIKADTLDAAVTEGVSCILDGNIEVLLTAYQNDLARGRVHSSDIVATYTAGFFGGAEFVIKAMLEGRLDMTMLKIDGEANP